MPESFFLETFGWRWNWAGAGGRAVACGGEWCMIV